MIEHAMCSHPGKCPACHPTPNMPMLRKLLEWAETQNEIDWDNPQREWDQSVWYAPAEARAYYLPEKDRYTCTSMYCIAGYACYLDDQNMQAYIDPADDEEELDILVHAQKVLGLTNDERLLLFAGHNNLDDIRRIMQVIAARAGEQL